MHHLLPYKERFFSRSLPFPVQQPEEASVRSIIHIPPTGDRPSRQKIFVRKPLRHRLQNIIGQLFRSLLRYFFDHLHPGAIKYQHLADPLCWSAMISYGRHFTTAIVPLRITVQVSVHFLPVRVLQAEMLQFVVTMPFQPIGIPPGNICADLRRHLRSPFHTYPVSCHRSFGEI